MTDHSNSDEVLREESDYKLSRFTRSDSWTLGVALHERLAERGAPAAVQVTHCGVVAFFSSLDGATLDNAAWAERKRAVVERFEHSSLWAKLAFGDSFHTRLRLPESDFAAVGGAIPLSVEGVGVVGTAAISGLTSDLDEHELLVATVKDLASGWTASPSR